MNLMQRLNAVMKHVAYVQKDKTIGDGRFAYRVATYDQVIAAVRQSFVDNGIMVLTRQVGAGKMVATGTFYGGKEGKAPTEAMRYEALYDVDFVNIDDPADHTVIQVETHSLDQGDKAPGKAQTYATKAAIKKVLLLESGDDEEGRVTTTGSDAPANDATAIEPAPRPAAKPGPKLADKSGPPASDGQIAFLRKKLTAAGKSEADLCAHLGRKSMVGLTEGEAKLATGWINGKVAA
jgi:hypothetical protein